MAIYLDMKLLSDLITQPTKNLEKYNWPDMSRKE